MAENNVVGNIFEKATREKIRFEHKGLLSVEDLWDLSVQELDSIFKKLSAKLRICKEDSLLAETKIENNDTELKINIIRYIVTTKLEEKAAKKLELEKINQRKRILEVISEKQDIDLKGKTLEELNKMLDDL